MGANVWNGAGVALPGDSSIILEKFTASAGQQTFNLTLFTYTLGTNALRIFANGLLLLKDQDYVETDTDTFTTTYGMQAGDEVLAIGNNFVATGDAATLRSDLASYTGSGLIGHIGAGSGAVSTNVRDELRSYYSNERLLSSTTVSFAANGDTTLYTVSVPAARCVLTKAVVVAGADAGATTRLSIGQNGATTDFIPVNTLSNLDAANDVVILQPIPNTTPLKNKSYPVGTVIKATVDNQSGGAINTVHLYGMLFL